ncbi:AGAP011616-PA-like protein [Anopheles sinensis]|uniref:AGAP011616-PA-like protein n=1 Tax=Anopheles sinensis TaxID=74873 RepID=A0A084WGT9_ANOSI|nr:AGAP011616-PA-like protein [Anopheles sinensis]
MSFLVFVFGISLAILSQTLAQTTAGWEPSETESTWLPVSTSETAQPQETADPLWATKLSPETEDPFLTDPWTTTLSPETEEPSTTQRPAVTEESFLKTTVTPETEDHSTTRPPEVTEEPLQTTTVTPETEEPWPTTVPPETQEPSMTQPPAVTEEPWWTTTPPPETEDPWPTTVLPETEKPSTTQPPAVTEEPLWTTTPPPETEEPSTTQPPALTQEPSEMSTASSSLNCDGISLGIVSHPSQCNKFVLCRNNYGWEVECPDGEIFSWKTLSCGTENSCSEYFEGHGNYNSLESEACKRQAQTYADHPYEFSKYVDCAKLTILSCPRNRIFRWKYQRCLPGSLTTNQLQSVSANCKFWGKKPHPYLCEQYFQCRVWASSLKSCPNGSIFHSPSNRCRQGNFQTCQYAY